MEEYTSNVLDYIQFCTETVLRTRTIKVFPNQKPWFDGNVGSLLRARDTAFRSGDMLAYRTARQDLQKGLKGAKGKYRQRIEGHFENKDPRRRSASGEGTTPRT